MSDEVGLRIRTKSGEVIDFASTPGSNPLTLEALVELIGAFPSRRPATDDEIADADEMLTDAGVNGGGEIEAIFAVAADGSETQVFPVQ